MDINLPGYYSRDDQVEKNYEEHLFIAGNVLQSAEMNEIQQVAIARAKSLGDALFRDGDVVRDARVVVDPDTGATFCESGAVYLRGAVRGVPSANITIPIVGSIAIGIWLIESIVTDTEDPTLRDPAAETRNYSEAGAARLKVEPQWGHQDDGTEGEFFPIYYADSGHLRAKEAPPQLDSVSQAIARYDRDSTGSSYIVSGLNVLQLDDLGDGTQVYSIQDGRARINGFGINLNTSRRLEYPTTPDLRYIDSEPHTSTTESAQRINLDRTPISNITQVRITKSRTVTLVHGTFSGAQDPLPDTSVVQITSVVQGATTYVQGTDYQLTAGRVDWSLSGDEPAPGSSYNVTYQYITSVTPTAVDDTGYTVTGAVVGTLVLTNYYVKLPRIDRLCMDESGAFVWVKGVATDYDPVRPQVPNSLMALCQVVQTWDARRRVIADGVRMVPMSDIEAITSRLDNLTDLVAQQKLVSDLATREQAAQKGMFVDPFLDDNQRDQGVAQNAAIIGFALTLPIDGDAINVSADVAAPTTCAFTLEPVLEQTARTGDMKINPYMAFDVPPKPVTLTPAVDRWTVTQTSWLSATTQKFIIDKRSHDWQRNINKFPSYTTTTMSTVLVRSSSSAIENLRQIEVKFEAKGFGPGEVLSELKFDGIVLTPTAI
jgi:hypothetical protein